MLPLLQTTNKDLLIPEGIALVAMIRVFFPLLRIIVMISWQRAA
jgi:hypothetical protein